MRITHCQVNHVTNPLGFALSEPTFTWQVENATGSKAEASRLVVTCDGEPVADTGWADLSSLATQVEGLGDTLVPRTRYEWRVSVRSNAGEEATSDVSWFETGKMGEPWEAAWVTCDAAEPRHPLFSKELRLRAGEVVSARLYVCGLGLYQVRFDDALVSDELLAPGTHAYDQWLQYQTYDVTSQVANGSMLSVLLGNGWYKGRFGFVKSDKGHYGDDWRLIAELRVTYADGTEQIIGTDDSWLVTRSTITFSNIYDGERRDDTLPELSPVAATLLDEAAATEGTAKLADRLSLPVTAHEEFAPTLIETPSGDTVLDMGQEFAGGFRLRVREPAGCRVRLQFGEILQDGEFYRDNLRTALAEYVYVSDGAEKVIEPAFTYYGYRYVRVEGFSRFLPEDFMGVAWYSDFDGDRGSIVTGNPKVNRLIENARWGMKSNFVDTATDCPQRDERMGWTGDANVFSGTALRLGAPYAFYAKYLRDMAHEQEANDGMVPMVIPAFGLSATGAVWGDATTNIAWNMYQADGDPAILADHYKAMRSWVDWIERIDGDEHGWGKSFQFGDWLALDTHDPAGRRGATDEGFIAYLFWWKSACIVAKAAKVLGHANDETRYRTMAGCVADWIRTEYYTATGRCAVNTQTAYICSLAFGFGDDDWSHAQLVKLLKENGGKLATGFVGTPLILPALSDAGEDRMAYDLLLGEDYPGWLHCVNLGATTIWERWNSVDDDGHITGTGMNSLNHYAYGSVVEWLWSYAAGLTAAKPGFSRTRIAPRPSWRLGSLDARIATAAGTWRVAWKAVGERRLRVAIEVPFGTKAEVELPLAPESAYGQLGGRTLGPGSYEVEYVTTEPLRRVPNVDWTVAQILDTPDASAVARRYVDGWDFSMMRADPAKTLRQLQAEGLGQNRKMTTEELEAMNADLRSLADQR